MYKLLKSVVRWIFRIHWADRLPEIFVAGYLDIDLEINFLKSQGPHLGWAVAVWRALEHEFEVFIGDADRCVGVEVVRNEFYLLDLVLVVG